MDKIIEMTPSHIRLRFEDKSVTIEGEAYARGYGNPDFVVYKNSIQRWDPPFDGVLIDEDTKDKILAELTAEMSKEKITIEIE